MVDKSEAYKIVFNDLMRINLYKGIYDAKNGNDTFMFGISSVMESIAAGVSEDCHNEFSKIFIQNMIKSMGGNNEIRG